jgi:IS1 family transposase
MACDEMWSVVGSKKHKQGIWLAKDTISREIVGVYVGSRDREGAQGLWEAFPGVYRQCAVRSTDFWSAYAEIFPSTRYRVVGKESGRTNPIESFHTLLRQRIAR